MGAPLSGANAPYPANGFSPDDIWTILGSQVTLKSMRQFDNWRKWIGFDSVEALIEAYEPVAKLQDVPVWDLINSDYHKWQEDRK